MIENIIFHKLFILLFLIAGLMRAYYTGYAYASQEPVSRNEEGSIIQTARFIIAIPVLLVCLFYIIFPPWVSWLRLDIPASFRSVGVILLVMGIVFYWYTHKYLGKNFTDTVFIRRDAQLVTTGPYKWVRHPMYTSGLMICIGAGLIAENWFIGLFGSFFILLVMYIRTPIEEKKLLDKFGDEYRDYIKKTSRFVPGF